MNRELPPRARYTIGMPGKIKGQRRPALSRRDPGPAEDKITSIASGPLLPTPSDPASAQFLAEYGVEAYYRHLATRRYYRAQYRRRLSAAAVPEMIIDLLYTESPEHNDRYRSRSEIVAELKRSGVDRAEADQALQQMIEMAIIDSQTGESGQIALIYPWSADPAPWPPEQELRQKLLAERGLENYYLHLGQAAAAWQYARVRAGMVPRYKPLIDRLYQTALDGQALTADQLIFSGDPRSDHFQQLVSDLQDLAQAEVIEALPSERAGGPVAYRLFTDRVLPEGEPAEPGLSAAQRDYITGYGIESYWQRHGRLQAAQQQGTAQAEDALEEQIINTLFRLQESSELSIGPERQELIGLIADNCSAPEPQVADVLDTLEQRQLVFSDQPPGLSASCCSLIDPQLHYYRLTEPSGPALLAAGLDEYHRRRGRALEGGERLFAAAQKMLSTSAAREIFATLVNAAASPDGPWVAVSRLEANNATALGPIFADLNKRGLIVNSPAGLEQKISLPHLDF